jgi:hypothetical protein
MTERDFLRRDRSGAVRADLHDLFGDVRSDVYLITQNALADNTFMNITRDLYGDTIYIPSLEDSNEAFRKYVDDVNAGRIQAGADIKIENGKVSVQGVGGVMTINGILAELIFKENKAKHDFYVEESYVIQWMYPYLTPNGIMLKLNKEPLPGLAPGAGEERPRVLGLVHEVAAGPARVPPRHLRAQVLLEAAQRHRGHLRLPAHVRRGRVRVQAVHRSVSAEPGSQLPPRADVHEHAAVRGCREAHPGVRGRIPRTTAPRDSWGRSKARSG